MKPSSQPSNRPSSAGRRCIRPNCGSHATHTLTYIYSDSTAVLGPLSTFVEPHAYDLCDEHSDRLKVPQGWTVIKNNSDSNSQEPSPDDVLAIAEPIRESARIEIATKSVPQDVGRRGHLRSIPNQD